MSIRQSAFKWTVRDVFKLPEGRILPKWAIGVRFILFPLQSIRWWLNKNEGYDVSRDVWVINKSHFTYDFLIEISNVNSGWFRCTGKDEHGELTFEWRCSLDEH